MVYAKPNKKICHLLHCFLSVCQSKIETEKKFILCKLILCHVDVLLGSDRETTRQRSLLGNDPSTTTEERCFLCGPCRDVINRRVSSVSKSIKWIGVDWSQVVGEWVRGLLGLSHCKLFLWGADSWGRGQFENQEEGKRPPLEATTE
jgi:hypothetical protein